MRRHLKIIHISDTISHVFLFNNLQEKWILYSISGVSMQQSVKAGFDGRGGLGNRWDSRVWLGLHEYG